jgi:glutamate synthase (NADPH) small chain
VLAVNEPAVSIKNIEVSIIERAYENNWIKPRPPKRRTGKTVAVIGSGPAGLACADQLNKAGNKVTVFEKNEVIGGLLTLGIPEFKMEKRIVQRRVKIMEAEGVVFKTGIHVGQTMSAHEIRRNFDAMVLCGGAESPRELPIPGRELEGIYQAMTFLPQQNRLNLGFAVNGTPRITAKGKKVVILGGGDTGSDCLGTSNRQGAVSVKQFELLPEPPQTRAADNPWPNWAFIQRSSSSHEEGVERDYCIMTKFFSGEGGKLKKLHGVRLEFGPKDPQTGRAAMKEIPGSEFEVETDLVLLAMGFLGPVKHGLLEELGVELNSRTNVNTNAQKMTNLPGVFAAGDMSRGQSLVVWAINEGRNAAHYVDTYLVGSSRLPLM